MALKSFSDVPIAVQEAMLFFGKTKKQVYWAIDKGKIKARQSCCSENWILSLDSCIALWGKPSMDLVTEIQEDWHEAQVPSQS